MSRRTRFTAAGLVGLVAIVATAVVSGAAAEPSGRVTTVEGTIWVANRGAHTIRGFDAATGEVVSTVAMRSGSQPGDLAHARGKLYVAEEFGTPPAIAVVDASNRSGREPHLHRDGIAAAPRAHESRRGPGRGGPLRNGHRRRRRHGHGRAARTVGHGSGGDERPGARRRLLARRWDALRRQRRHERGDRARPADRFAALAADRAGGARARRRSGRGDALCHPPHRQHDERDRPAHRAPTATSSRSAFPTRCAWRRRTVG